MAAIHEQLKEYDAAIENYEKSNALWTSFLDPVEGIISIYTLTGDWANLQKWMKRLYELVKDDKLRVQLNQAIKRIDDGLADAR